MSNVEAAHAKLRDLRTRKDLKIRPTKFLKETFTDFAGREVPLVIRYYQVQGVLHMVVMKRFLLGDDTGLGKCKPYGSLLLTERGLIRLGDLAPKGIDLTPDTFYPLDQPVNVWTGWEWAPVKSFYHSGKKPTLTVRTRRGYETTGSFVHPLWIRHADGTEGFVKMLDLKPGDVVGISRSVLDFPGVEPELPNAPPKTRAPNTKAYPTPDHLTPDLAAFLAYTVAEGWTNSPMSVIITQHAGLNPETHAHIRQLAKSLFGWEGSPSEETVQISSVVIRAYLEGLGIGMGLSATKSVPWPIFQGTGESVTAFLRAFFDSEGSVDGDVVEVTSASERMLREIQILLLRFGIVCSRRPKKVKGYEHTYWRLTICGDDARSFYGQIGFLTPRKQKALEALLLKAPNANLDVVPYAGTAVEALRAEILKATSTGGTNDVRKGTGLKQFGVSFEKTLNNIRNGGRNPTYAFLDKMLLVARGLKLEDTPAYREISDLCTNHFFYDPIESSTLGEDMVADIEVDVPRHSFVADGFINHNTLETLAALCYVWEKEPDRKVLILTTKSSQPQWIREIGKFTRGVKAISCAGSKTERQAARKLFEKSTGPTVMVMGYRSAVQDFSEMQDYRDMILIYDEATAFKNPTTQVHQVCRHLSGAADRVYGLTATLLKNNLMEAYGIYQVIVPGLFGMNRNNFMLYYCLTRMQPIPGRANRQIPVIVGYTPEKIKEFKGVIDPYYLGRPKHEVASDLPVLSMQEIEVPLTPLQETKYAEALAGILEKGDGQGGVDLKEVSKLTAIIYCQQIINHPLLIDVEGESPKLEALIEFLSEGDFAEEKVIVYTRFKSLVDIIMVRLAKEKIKAVRVTGDENAKERDAAMQAFQNPDGDVRVVCITTAGSEAINLQAAKALVCVDTPFSAGEFIQLIGRMIRIGSVHDRCSVVHLIAKGKKKTVDHRVMEILGKKMELFEAVLGKRLKGEGDTSLTISVENDISDLFQTLKNDAREARKGGA